MAGDAGGRVQAGGPGPSIHPSPGGRLARRAVTTAGRTAVLSLILALAIDAEASAQAEGPPAVIVGQEVLVSADLDRPVVEPWIAVHPDDPSTLLATAMVAAPLPSPGEGLAAESICATWLSTDGGHRWSRHDQDLPGCADPWVLFTRTGTALFTALGKTGAWVCRSGDGGAAWEPGPVPMGRGHDHPVLVADTSDGPFAGRIYFASGRAGTNAELKRRWTVYVASSDDDGRSFPVAEQVIPSNLNYEAQLPAVLSDGTFLVAFSDHHTMGGQALNIGARRSWALRSADGGVSFSEPLFITDACDGRGGWPMLAAAPDDRLLFTCIAADLQGVLVFWSDDQGESWQGPVRADDGGDSAHTRTPTLAVTPTGIVGIAWYDRSDDPDRACQHTRFAASLDGGESFLTPVRVSNEASCPDTEANLWTAGRFPAGGDYSGLAAVGPGAFRLAWSDARDGVYRLRSAEVRVSPSP